MAHPRIAIAPNDDPRWERAKEGDLTARNSLVEEHIRLLDQVTAVVCAKLPFYASRDDIWSFGSFGLIRAVETYDPDIASFRTHAVFLIKARIYDELRSMDWVPKSTRKKIREVDAAHRDLANGDPDSRPFSAEEIATTLGVDASYVTEAWQAKRSSSVGSLDDYFEGSQERSDVSIVSSSTVVADYLATFSAWLSTLSIEEQAVWSLRFYCRKTSKEVAVMLGVSPSTISQISSKIFQSFHVYVDEIQTVE